MTEAYYPTSVTVHHRQQREIFYLTPTNANNGYNLQLLFDRTEPGTLFRANQEGRLVIIEGFWNRLSYFWNRKAEQKAVKEVVSEALKNYNDYLSRNRDEKMNRFCVGMLFQRIGHLSPRVLDRTLFFCHNQLSRYSLSPNTVRVKVGETYEDYTVEDLKPEDSPFLELDLEDDKGNANFARLIKRKEGEHFRVNVQGELEGVYWYQQQSQEKDVRDVVTSTLSQLNCALQKTKVTKTHKAVLNKIFTEGPLMRMKPVIRKMRKGREVVKGIYDRGAIVEGSYLEGVVAEAFGSQLKEKRDALKTAMKTYRALEQREAKATLEAKFMDLVLEEYNFAYKLGLDLERVGDGGSGGARYARDRHGRTILVVKPGDEGPHGCNNPQWYAKIKRWFVSPRECMKGNSEPLNEVDSYLFDRKIGIYQVPPTEWRYVASRQFNGEVFKECSVQMFVEGATTIGKYINISPTLSTLPRPLLRWYCGEERGWMTRTQKRKELLEKVPQETAERFAAHNLGIEDIDCHFENLLVLLRDEGGEPNLAEPLINGDTVDDREIDHFIDTFFEKGNNQILLQALLFSEVVEVNGERKRMTFVKHDGGSSNPRSHPEGYLSTRFKHLFEVLPHYEESFTTRDLLNKERQFVEFLLEKSVRALRNTLTPQVFSKYWNGDQNRLNFKLWVLETDPKQEEVWSKSVRDDLIEASSIKKGDENKYRIYFKSHLKRIRENISTRLESWRLLNQFLSNQRPMRDALLTCTQADFERKLTEPVNNDFLAEAQNRGVKRGDAHFKEKYFVGEHVLADLGERDVNG
ncbi:MAG: hypothetical protein JJU12_03870 [Chlamydiales bacterium]|nr:hypothetical protein [Chlamydiales bacterium]